MSQGRMCDNCGLTLILDDRGEDEHGEIHAWLRIGTLDGKITAEGCTRECARALLADDGPLAAEVDARLEAVSEVVRAIRSHEADS